MDVIIAPPDEFCFALVGWIGSRTYLRFMRAFAKDQGLYLNSHRWGGEPGGHPAVTRLHLRLPAGASSTACCQLSRFCAPTAAG